MKKYIRIWILFLLQASQIAFASRIGAVLFFVGKLMRFFSFLLFLVLLSSRITAIAGYSIWQISLFYLTYAFIDAIPQFLFREVYRFRNYVVKGDFDYFLTKPLSPLFRSLFGGSDILDIPNLILYIAGIGICLSHISFNLTGALLYIVFTMNGVVIATAFHIAILSLGILTTEIDNAMMFYRDLTVMGRFPIDIYKEPIRSFLTFIIPIGIMITIPVKALFFLTSRPILLLSLVIGGGFFYASILFWRYALSQYTSASS